MATILPLGLVPAHVAALTQSALLSATREIPAVLASATSMIMVRARRTAKSTQSKKEAQFRMRRTRIAGLGGLGATALLLFACQGQGAFNAIQEKLSEISDQQTQILQRIEQLEGKIQNMPAAPAPAAGKQPAQAPGPQPGRPDPAATYKVAVGDAQSKGPADAKITVVEWSDFQ